MKLDKEIIEEFNAWQQAKGGDIDLSKVEFTLVQPFQNTGIYMLGPKLLGNHNEIGRIQDTNGLPVYDASGNILTKIAENRFPDKVFVNESDENPPISYASEGNSSAGANFFIHNEKKFFVNNHRIVIFCHRSNIFSKYLMLRLKGMKSEFGFERGYTPSMSVMRNIALYLPVPKGENSLAIQKEIVEFIETKQEATRQWKDAANSLAQKVEAFERLLVAKCFEKEKSEDLLECFHIWQEKHNRKEVDLSEVEFEEVFPFDSDEFFSTETPKLNHKQSELIEYDGQGSVPVFAGGNHAIKRVNKSLHPDKLITADSSSIKISFASDGENAGGNFLVHDGDFFVNASRTVLTFKGHADPFYFYYALLNMREVYRFNWKHKANARNLKKVSVVIPKGENSLAIQKEIVAFIRAFQSWRKRVQHKVEECLHLCDEYEQVLLAKIFRGGGA